MSAFISEQPNRARLFDERRNDGVSVRGEERSRKRYAVRDDERRPRRGTPDYNETPVDGRALHVLKYIRQFHVSPSTVRTSFARVFRLQAAKQCTKPDRLNRRAAAPAASATVNIQKITKRAFDGRTLHSLKHLHYVDLIRYFHV